MTGPSPYFSDQHDTFRDSVRRFLAAEVAPHADDWERAGRIPREVFLRMGELGLLGVTAPAAYGGAEGDTFFAVALLEELPRSLMGGFCAAVAVQQFIATAHISRWGAEALRQRYLAPSVRGELVGALAVTEPDTGSDVASLRTRAVRDGSVFRLTGAKTFITNGAESDFIAVAARTSADEGPAGISILVVDADTPGVAVSRRLDTLGWHCSDTAELAFDDVAVPAGNLVGVEGMGFVYLMEAFQLERLTGAAIAVGSADLALERTLAYMEQRRVFGRPLTRFPVLTHRLAGLAAEVEAARQLVYRAAWLLDRDEPAVRECTMAKLVATELAARVADACLQCFGGYGYMEELPLARLFRDARAGTIAAGTSDVMREILARMMTGDAPPERPGHGAPRPAAASPAPPPSPTAQEEAVATPPATAEELVAGLPGRFRPERAEGWQARLHLRLDGAASPEWTVVVGDGSCTVAEGLEGRPDCVVDMQADTYVGIETGRVNPQVAFMMRKIKVSDLGVMTRFLKAFRPLAR